MVAHLVTSFTRSSRSADPATARADPRKAMTNLDTAPGFGMKADARNGARCFLRLANLPNFALDRPKPQERMRRFRFADHPDAGEDAR